ncbi:hypothetical protein P692DRAFT_20820818 [Suillus brevipes Sb2]|nr:hypothetical protein P692DRAFT_20820818 [Suillus brevipes Sb2]
MCIFMKGSNTPINHNLHRIRHNQALLALTVKNGGSTKYFAMSRSSLGLEFLLDSDSGLKCCDKILRYQYYTPPQSIRSRLHSGVRLTAGGHFVHHHFQAAEPAEVKTVTDHRNGDGKFTNNRDTQQSNFPQADLFPHSPVTTSSVNTTQVTHHICAQEQPDELEGTDVSDEVVYDADALSPLDSDVNHAVAMIQGNSCLGAPFVVVNSMTVVPNRVDEPAHGSELSPSCMEDEMEWYHISQAVVAAAKAASQLEHAAAESQSSALATAMDTYIEWPEEDSEVE